MELNVRTLIELPKLGLVGSSWEDDESRDVCTADCSTGCEDISAVAVTANNGIATTKERSALARIHRPYPMSCRITELRKEGYRFASYRANKKVIEDRDFFRFFA